MFLQLIGIFFCNTCNLKTIIYKYKPYVKIIVSVLRWNNLSKLVNNLWLFNCFADLFSGGVQKCKEICCEEHNEKGPSVCLSHER